MTLKILGCCSGVEPVAKCGHASFVIEAGEEVYWFNTGEGCSDTAHLITMQLWRLQTLFRAMFTAEVSSTKAGAFQRR